MRRALLSLYHRMPPTARGWAASIRGWQLRRLRYGPESEALVQAALERDYWPADRWRDWVERNLEATLDRARRLVPHYRRIWDETRSNATDPERSLSQWPILEKSSLRAARRQFLADDFQSRRLVEDHTSGTSGTPLHLWFDPNTIRNWFALYEARCRRWHGVSRFDAWANIGGQLVVPVRREKPPYWVWNAALNQLYLSSYHLRRDALPAYLDALEHYRVKFLLGYTSSLYELAVGCLESGRTPPALSVVLTNAEPLNDRQRRAITEAFRCPVRETYGMSEMATNASECDAGRLHLWPEVGLTEVVDGDAAVEPGEVGDLLLTGLLNPAMPLIRYRVGDRGCLADPEERCPCGRTLPILKHVEGRSDDVLITPDGRRVGRLDPVFKSDFQIAEAQILQTAPDRLTVKYVPASGFEVGELDDLTQRLRDRLGDMTIQYERVDRIPRGANGKFRAVVNAMTPDAGHVTSPG